MTHLPAPDPSPIPPDDLGRSLKLARPEDDALPHIGLVGDSYTVLVSGEDTLGRFCLIDMLVPAGGGPPPHRHDFEETFTVLEGELELTFRGQTTTLRAGGTANVPANAPHVFRNATDAPVHMLCLCSPAGQEDFFAAAGDALPSRDAPVPHHTPEEMAARGPELAELAARYRSEFVERP